MLIPCLPSRVNVFSPSSSFTTCLLHFLLHSQMLSNPGPGTVERGTFNEDQLTGPGTSTRVWVADVNGDGKLDLIVWIQSPHLSGNEPER